MNHVHINHEKRMDAARAFIREHWEVHHYSPSIVEISDALGGISKSMVSYYIGKLVKEGWLEPRKKATGRGYGAARNIVPAEIFRDRSVFPVHTHGFDIATDEDHTVEALVEKMTDGRIAIVKAKKATKFPGISDIVNINTISKETP